MTNFMCSDCKKTVDPIYKNGCWNCPECKKKISNKKNKNTNKKRGENRNYDFTGQAHSIKAKGSHNGVRTRNR